MKEPFLTVRAETGENRVKHYGLGYSIEYEIGPEDGTVYGATFWLFDTFVVWGWIT